MSQIYKASSGGGGGAVSSVSGNNGVTASPNIGAVVVSGVPATTSTLGVASFNPTEFTVTGGAVSSNAITINTSGSISGGGTVNLGGTISLTGSASGGITTIDGNTGSVTGTTVSILGPANGQTPTFSGSGTTLSLNFSDANSNTIIGSNAGFHATAGTDNTYFGSGAGNSNITSGANTFIGNLAGESSTGGGCTMIGSGAGSNSTTGSDNLYIGLNVANNMTTESNNIVIGNTSPNAGISGQIYIGSTNQTSCYISGIGGVTVGGSVLTTINTSSNQLGSTSTIPSGVTVPTTTITGITSGASPAAGHIGEQLRAINMAGTTLTSGTAANLATLSLTAGIWDVSSMVQINSSATLTATSGGISSLSAAFSGNSGDNYSVMNGTGFSVLTLAVPSFRVSLSATTNYFLVAQATGTGTLSGFGRISATRVA